MAEKVVLPENVTAKEPQVSEVGADQVPMSSLSLEDKKDSPPCCVIVLGMAGSGKTTFVQRFIVPF